ncbi:dTMP kinase [Catellatospora methionotrophica]|uniref:dTMP kinase n=1 Tax=Catellatospora methionotrophica TaxID=121620 RepID=UPI0033F8104D
MAGRFVVLEGGDGVGKTTLARMVADLDYDQALKALAEQAPSGLVYVPRRQISGTSDYSASLMRHLSTMLWDSGDSPDLPDSFWVALQAAWFTAHATTVIGPLLDAGCDVIVDGWVYKFFSKLLQQGYDQAALDTIFARVRMPDAVILLTADPAVLYDRRDGQFRPAELGMHADLPDLGKDTFVAYQAAGQRLLRETAVRRGWPTMLVDADEQPDQTAARLTPIVAELRRHDTLTYGGSPR